MVVEVKVMIWWYCLYFVILSEVNCMTCVLQWTGNDYVESLWSLRVSVILNHKENKEILGLVVI